MNLDDIAGVAHAPHGTPQGVVVLTHGAGGSRESPLLKQLCDEWARRGWLAVRYNLPYRRRRPKGPPSGSAATDREGVAEAVTLARTLADGPVVAGGHSYGGRQTSMAVADHRLTVDLLMLFSYPLHPPGKPERKRTEHLPHITTPTVFTHGTSDPFGTVEELRAAAALIPAPTEIVEVTGARHDLGSKTLDVPALAVNAAMRLLRLNRPADHDEGHYLHGMTQPSGPPPGYQPYQPYPTPYQPAAPYPAYPAHPTKPGTNGFAIASLILGILSVVLLSVIFGIIALRQIKRTGQSGRGMAIAGLVISGVWVLAFAALITLAVVFDDGSVRATSIKTGDCIADTPADGANVTRLPKVSCDEPHEGEVYAMIRVTGDTFPGQTAMQSEYEQRCVSELDSYAPDAANDPKISSFLLYPSRETWDAGDRDVACIAITNDKRTGSIKQ